MAILTGMLIAACAFAADDAQLRQSIERGRQFLLSTDISGISRGEMALVTLALVKSEAPLNEPRLAGFIEELAKHASVTPYKPAGSVPDTYEVSVLLMALATIDARRYSSQINNLAEYLLSRQSADGPWDYLHGATGDTSQTQYAILALWEASAAGVRVPAHVWDRCAAWLVSRQDVDGGFAYHPMRPQHAGRNKQTAVTHSMSVAGTGTLVICRKQLSGGRAGPVQIKRSKDADTVGDFPLLIPVGRESEAGDKSRKASEANTKRLTTSDQIDEAIQLGIDWMDAHFTVEKPTGPMLYYLYGVERLGNLAGVTSFGSTDWFVAGSDYLIKMQRPDGGWVATNSNYRMHVESSFALLFLVQSTRKSAQRFEVVRLEGGDLTGGRGLPTSDDVAPELRQRQSARYRDALKTSVDEVLASLESIDEAVLDESAVAAVEVADPKTIAEKFGNNTDKLRRLTKSPQPEVRQAALWALARCGDLRMAPVLIDGLADSDPEVYRAALGGLKFLSRRADGFGMPDEPLGEEKRERGIERWREWFNSLKIEIPAAQEFEIE